MLFITVVIFQIMNFKVELDSEGQQHNHKDLLKKDFKISKTFILSDEHEITFEIPSFSDRLKFAFTANIDLRNKETKDIRDIDYSVEYTLWDRHDQAVASNIHHLKTAYIQYVDTNNTDKEIKFYSTSSLLPAATQILSINLNDYKDVSKITFVLHHRDKRIVDLGIRSYYLERMPKNKLHRLWNRMYTNKRKELFEGNIYDLYNLTQKEKDTLLSALWRPNGPLGIEGEDYRSRSLLIRNNFDDLYPSVEHYPNFYSAEHLNGTRYLEKGHYTIDAVPMYERNATFYVRYYSDEIPKVHKNYRIRSNYGHFDLELKERGLIVFESNTSIAYDIKEKETNTTLYLPPIISSGYYSVDMNHTLEYIFFSPQKRFIRIECRSEENNTTTVRIALKDKQGKDIKIIEKSIVFLPSLYDYGDGLKVQSEPVYLYIALPENIKALELSSRTPVLAKLSSRSDTVPYPIYTLRRFNEQNTGHMPAWFTMRPKDFYLSEVKERHRKLYKQERPPEVKEAVQAGKYRYEQLFPQNSWQGYEVFFKRPKDNCFIRSQSWSSIYSKIAQDTVDLLDFHSDTGEVSVKPNVVYHSEEKDSHKVMLSLDGYPILQKSLYGKAGMIELPPVSLDEVYELDLNTTADLDLYISNTALSSKTYMKRSFILFDRPMHFIVEKYTAQEETLGFQLGVNRAELLSSFPCDLNITAVSEGEINAYNKFSFSRYRLNFDTVYSSAISLMNQGEKLYLSPALYLTLGENVKPGRYRIIISPPKGISPAYLYMNHLILDQYDTMRVSKEAF